MNITLNSNVIAVHAKIEVVDIHTVPFVPVNYGTKKCYKQKHLDKRY